MTNKTDRVAIILAAGRSTRYEEDINKCVAKFETGNSFMTPISSVINSCLASGIFNFIIVTGYKASDVRNECDRLNSIYGNRIKIDYVKDEDYDKENHSRNDSIKVGLESVINSSYKECYLFNGDTFIAPQFISRLVDCPYASIMTREKVEGIDNKLSSYINIFSGEVIDSIVDKDATEDPRSMYAINCECYKFINDFSESILESSPDEYYIINKLISEFVTVPVWVHMTDGIYDINTKEDYEKTKKILDII